MLFDSDTSLFILGVLDFDCIENDEVAIAAGKLSNDDITFQKYVVAVNCNDSCIDAVPVSKACLGLTPAAVVHEVSVNALLSYFAKPGDVTTSIADEWWFGSLVDSSKTDVPLASLFGHEARDSALYLLLQQISERNILVKQCGGCLFIEMPLPVKTSTADVAEVRMELQLDPDISRQLLYILHYCIWGEASMQIHASRVFSVCTVRSGVLNFPKPKLPLVISADTTLIGVWKSDNRAAIAGTTLARSLRQYVKTLMMARSVLGRVKVLYIRTLDFQDDCKFKNEACAQWALEMVRGRFTTNQGFYVLFAWSEQVYVVGKEVLFTALSLQFLSRIPVIETQYKPAV